MGDFDSKLKLFAKISDTQLLFKTLVAIRKDVDWPKCNDNINKLRDKGCLKDVVTSLQSSHKNIVNVSLSILGNCCMNSSCARELKHHHILSVLNQLLKRFTVEEDGINGRIYRLLGNLCQHKDDWSVIIIERKPQLVEHVVDALKLAAGDECSYISEATIVMAIRFIRELLSSNTFSKLVKTFGVVQPLGLLLLKYSGLWSQSKQHENILYNVIKTIYEYSKYKCHFLITELKNTEKGNCLVCLSDILLLAPRKIVKIVMNLLQISQLQSDLPVSEICDGFMKILQDKTFVKEFQGEYVEYIQCICQLFDHPANRNTSRCGKSISLLVNTLKDFKEMSDTTLTCSILIIMTLNKCKYNETLIMDQIKCDIIKVLTEKLEWVVGSSTSFNLKHKHERKRKYKSTHVLQCKRNGLTLEELKQPASASSSDDEGISSYNLYECSPSTSSDSDSDWSMSSIFRWQSHINDVSACDSDDYSPVCSDTDMNEFDIDLSDDKNDLIESVTNDDMKKHNMEVAKAIDISLTCANLRSRLIIEIIRLLKTYIKIQPPNQQLAFPDLLLALLKSSRYFGSTVSSRIDGVDIVCQILQSCDYLIPLMLTDFIPTVYELTNIQHSSNCSKCTQFSYIGTTILRRLGNLAESAVGKGNIAHKMLRGSDDMKEKLTLVIPYIVRNQSILSKLMVNCGGLETLMKLLQGNDALRVKSIKVLCVLAAKNLGICNPKKVSGLHQRVINKDEYKLKIDCSKVVTFKLDDGSSVKADREFLSSKSDYFNTLFNGNFKESEESVIRLCDVNSRTLQYLLHLLQYDIEKIENIELNLDLSTLLDMIAQSDKFLLVDLCVLLTNSIEQYKISPETVPEIYQWSIESGTNLLRVESIAFALVANISDENRFAMFNRLFDLGYPDELIDDIRRLLLRFLNAGYHN